MIWFWIALAVVLILLGLFVFSQGGQSIGPAITTIGVAILLILLVSPARARDDGRYAGSPLKLWFEKLKSKGGASCCDGSDGFSISDVDWETKDGSYRVRLDGQWIAVPDSAVITEPNRAGRTMVWPVKYLGSTTIRCFMPGSMT